MEKVFEQNGLVLYKDGDTIVGDLSKEEVIKNLEEFGVETLSKGDFDNTLRTATIAARVLKSYKQRINEESSDEEDLDENLRLLLELVAEAYETDMLDQFITLMALTHTTTGHSVIDLLDEFRKQLDKLEKEG